jgi:hypothetical protein
MKYLIYIFLIILQTKCFSQEPYNYVLCNNVKIYKGNSKKYLTTCSINEKNLVGSFGAPDSIIIINHPEPNYEKNFSYTQNSFFIPSPNNGLYICIKTDLFRIMINDSIEIKVGSTIEKVLKYYPKLSPNKSQSQAGVTDISIYHVYHKEDLLDITKYCLSDLVIRYLADCNRITEIIIFDIN